MTNGRQIRLLILSRYGRKGPSSRLRYFQYEPYLLEAGFTVDVDGFLPDSYLEALYTGKRISIVSMVMSYWRRLWLLLRVRDYDLIWMEKEFLPWFPAFVERWLRKKNVRLVADYDDAWYLRYRSHKSYAFSKLFPTKIEDVMAAADLVMAGNPIIAEQARLAGARRIVEVPTVLETDHYITRRHETRRPVRIVWIGTALNSAYLPIIQPALAQLSKLGLAELVVVGGRPLELPGVSVRFEPWSEETEAAQLASCDIGIMPLHDSAWDRGKCAFKILQYMAAGLPVVASPVGVNNEIVTADIGFLASTEQEWVEALSTLCASAERRATMGAAGRVKVEAGYSLHVWGPRVTALLMEIAKKA